MRATDETFPPPAFDGFPPEAMTFFRTLAACQDRAWVAANKDVYERAVQRPLASLVVDVARRLAERDIPLRGDPKRAIFRLNRDIRFSKDKRPYKTQAGAALTRDGDKLAPGVLYVHIDPEGSFAAAGFYRPEPADLGHLRTRMAEKPAAWRDLAGDLAARGLPLGRDDTLVRPPKGFEAPPPDIAADLKLKSWIVSRPLSRTEIGAAGLVERLVDLAVASEPLLRFGWAALDGRAPDPRRTVGKGR